MAEVIRLAKLTMKDIGVLNAVVAAHDGLACMRTIDPVEGIVKFWVPEERLDEFDDCLRSLVDWLPLEIMAELPDGMNPAERPGRRKQRSRRMASADEEKYPS